MYVIFVIAIVLIASLFFLLDRALKAIQRGRRRRDASERLDAVARAAEQEHRQRTAQHEESAALTNVLPAIRSEDDDRGPRKVALSSWGHKPAPQPPQPPRVIVRTPGCPGGTPRKLRGPARLAGTAPGARSQARCAARKTEVVSRSRPR
jgi:hypothetical protein